MLSTRMAMSFGFAARNRTSDFAASSPADAASPTPCFAAISFAREETASLTRILAGGTTRPTRSPRTRASPILPTPAMPIVLPCSMRPAFCSPFRTDTRSAGPCRHPATWLEVASPTHGVGGPRLGGHRPRRDRRSIRRGDVGRAACAERLLHVYEPTTLYLLRGGRSRGGDTTSGAERPAKGRSKDLDEGIGGPKVRRDATRPMERPARRGAAPRNSDRLGAVRRDRQDH